MAKQISRQYVPFILNILKSKCLNFTCFKYEFGIHFYSCSKLVTWTANLQLTTCIEVIYKCKEDVYINKRPGISTLGTE